MSKNTLEQTIEPHLVNKENAAHYLSISTRLLDELVRSGEIRPIRVASVRRLAFDVSELKVLVQTWKDKNARSGFPRIKR